MTFTQGDVDAYITATKDALQNGADATATQTDAWAAIYGKIPATISAPVTIGGISYPATSSTQAAIGAALKTALDSIAKKEINQDNAFAKVDTSGAAPKSYDVTDLFGNAQGEPADKFTVASTLDADKNLKITLKNKDGRDTEITIKNADKLRAGDVITISSEQYTPTKPAATGKDALRLQAGANAGQEVALGINSMKAKDLNIVQTKAGSEGAALNVTNQADASLAVNAYDMAIQKFSAERAKMGAVQNRLEHTISNLDTSSENLQSAESRIRDTDMAEEMT